MNKRNTRTGYYLYNENYALLYALDTLRSGYSTLWILYALDTLRSGYSTLWILYALDTLWIRSGYALDTLSSEYSTLYINNTQCLVHPCIRFGILDT